MKTLERTFLFITLVSILPVYANSLDNPEKDVEKITIRGAKLSTFQEDFAGSATVITSELAHDFGIDRLRDISALVPNMQITQLGQMGGSFISFRGISSNPFVVNRASVYIDGIPYREINNQLLNNIDQIEVLKGPQGTLYGSNTEAGVVIVNSKRPTEALELDLSVESYWHTNGNNQGVNGSVSGGLIGDEVVGRLSFSHQRGDAFVVNTAAIDDIRGEIEEASVQADLFWLFEDESYLRFLALWESNKAPGLYEQEFVPTNLDLYNELYSQANNGRRLGEYELSQDVIKNTDEDENFIAIAGRTALSGVTIEGNLSHSEHDDDSAGVDLDLTATPIFRGAVLSSRESTFGEIKFSQQGDFSWLFGLNIFNEKKSRSLGAQDLTSGQPTPTFETPQFRESTDIGAFTTMSYLTESQWRFELGGRYERSNQRLEQGAIALFIPGVGAIASEAQSLEEDFFDFLPRFAISKQIGNNDLAYASAAKGWLPGGFNLAAARQVAFEDFAKYDKETLWHYELGYKFHAFDDRLFASAAIFYINAENWQEFSVFTDEQGVVASTNLISSNGSVVSRGAEFEFRFRASDALLVSGGIGITDAYYDEYQFSASQSFTGNDVPLTPTYDASLAIQYNITDSIYMNLHANFLGRSELNVDNTASQSSYAVIAARMGYETDNWAVELFAENLTDELYYSGLAYENFLFGSDGLFYAPAGAPRQVGVRVDYFY